ncbi:hypothetical protein T484DRAFT_1896983, partial [Baffinella frigidus]
MRSSSNAYVQAGASSSRPKAWNLRETAQTVKTNSVTIFALGDGSRLAAELSPGYFGVAEDELELAFVLYPQDDHADRLLYAGQMRERSKTGLGCTEDQAGVRYEGHWRSNQRNGLGVETTPAGVYEGQFTADLRDGFGVFTKTNGPTYVGEWKNGDWHGHGIVQQDTHSGGVKETFVRWEFGFNVAPGVASLQTLLRTRVEQVQKEAARIGVAAREVGKEARER